MTDSDTTPVARLYAEMGITLRRIVGAGTPVTVTVTCDWNRIARVEHHALLPVAIAAAAAADPVTALRLFPGHRLTGLSALRPSMDGDTARALARLAGIDYPAEWYEDGERLAEAFTGTLCDALDRHGLWDLFRDAGTNTDHHAIRPLGAHRGDSIADGVKAFRRAFRDLAPCRQYLAATIVCLYRGEKDTTWLKGIAAWPAVTALATMRRDDPGAYIDWHALVALYPGW